MTGTLRTQIGIIGSGPAGLLLSQLLANAGIDSILIERQSRAYVEGRVRAGMLEWGTVETLREAGAGAQMDRDGLVHDGFDIAFDGRRHRIDMKALTGRSGMVYGQTEITRDLIAHRLSEGAALIYQARDARIEDASGAPVIHFTQGGREQTIRCDFVAGCDGFHGISRKTIPGSVLRTVERTYPFGWLGILTERPPVSEELIYASHGDGFALCSMRSPVRSRYYVQVPLSESVADWPDERFWEALATRIGPAAAGLQTGPSFSKSIAPLRSFVAEPMRWGRLFLAGDAAHIVPPTGAKGLNLAVGDVRALATAFIEHYRGSDTVLDGYSEIALRRVWKAERFSWYFTNLLHRFPDRSPFDRRMQQAEFDYVASSETASRSVAENYVGLPFEI